MRRGIAWAYATRSLGRGGQRTVLAIFCVAIGVLAIVALQLVGLMVRAGLTENVRLLNGGDLRVSSYLPITTGQLATFDQLRATGVLTSYTALHDTGGTADSGARVSIEDNITVVDPATFPLDDGAAALASPAGDAFDAALGVGQVVLSPDLAAHLALAPGGALHLVTDDGRSGTLTVSGILVQSGFFAGRRDQIVLGRAAFAALTNASASAPGYETVLADVPGHSDAAAATAATAIQRALPLVGVVTTQQALQANQQTVQNIRAFLQVAGMIALLIGGMGIINTMQVSLRRRRTEIATLKTAGYRQRDLLALFGLETGLLGTLGGVVGTLGGVGVAIFVKSLVERTVLLRLPLVLDPATIASGVAIGTLTALLFGLLPIVEASQVRPVAVLRESAEGFGLRSAATVAGLLLLLGAVFTLLATGIIGNLWLAAALVAGMGVLLALAGGLCAGIAWGLSRLPMPDEPRWWQPLAIVPPALLAALIAAVAPTFGVIVFGALTLVALLAVLPRAWRVTVKLALRDLGRQRARTATTMVALGMGVFGIGLILGVSQTFTTQLNQLVAAGNRVNVLILAHNGDHTIIAQQLTRIPDLTSQDVILVAHTAPLAINGEPIAAVLARLRASGRSVSDEISGLNLTQGYDLAGGQAPPGQIIVKSGARLGPGDAGTNHIMLPAYLESGALALRVGDQIQLGDANGKLPLTLTIIGFYTAPGLPLIGDDILADAGVVNHLTSDQPEYIYALHSSAANVDAQLRPLRAAAPAAQVISVADLVAEVTALLNNVVVLLEAIAALSVLAGLIIIANTVTLAMIERRRELGILKSLGYRSRSVLGQALCEQGVAVFVAATLALALAGLALNVLERFVFNFALLRGGGLGPAIIGGLIVAATTLSVAVTTLVAWGATRVRPMEVLRYE